METRFILGAAGTGKTHRCLSEIRSALQESAEGRPLLFLAPKQATFQLERQLLSQPGTLAGYTRLQILSFDRLAQFVLTQMAPKKPALLNDQGRVMVLRAILGENQNQLQVFRSTARLPGFAQQLSKLLSEFQQSQITPGQISHLSQRRGLRPDLSAKLQDVSLVYAAYLSWLADRHLQDEHRLIDLAADQLRAFAQSPPAPQNSQLPGRIAGVWLDGFAEMTAQELNLLSALLPLAEQATLAFCLDQMPSSDLHWLSSWSVIARTFRRCHQQLSSLPGVVVQIEVLPRLPGQGRFAHNPFLYHLERHWAEPIAPSHSGQDLAAANTSSITNPVFTAPLPDSLRIIACPTQEAEAVFAARQILQHVKAGSRFRDIAVLVRSLDPYHSVLSRIFQQYQIPFFLDRRESVAHHPLAELTRFALRTIAFGWKQDDWFATLKTGLMPVADPEIDFLENEARARGWEGAIWLSPFPEDIAPSLESTRARVVRPLLALSARLARPSDNPVETTGSDGPSPRFEPTGPQLSSALRELWTLLDVPSQLAAWSLQSHLSNLPEGLHSTVWDEMNVWLDNLALAFASVHLPLPEWFPILETGLSSLTVGIIPPALDQVLIGAVDRSRNPDLQLVIVLGLNETVFPAPIPPPPILSDTDRLELESNSVALGPTRKQRLGHERFLAYIACTRSAEKLILTHALANNTGNPLNPSPFISHLQHRFPSLQTEHFQYPPHWRQSEHLSELLPALLANETLPAPDPELQALTDLPSISPVVDRWRHLQSALKVSRLPPVIAQQLYGKELSSSISALEHFAACPFRFFIHAGLRAKERKKFEVDPRAKGSFQHAVLQQFHASVQSEGKRWRDLSSREASDRIAQIGHQLLATFQDGLFASSESSQFQGVLLIESLQSLIATLIGWMPQYQFDPTVVELGFGFPNSFLPAWRIPLAAGQALLLRGWIDRVDLCRPNPNSPETLAVVLDYKSSGRKLDPIKLNHGLDLQLLCYLAALKATSTQTDWAGSLIPVGVFYVNLRGDWGRASSRNELGNPARNPYQHAGRFNFEYLKFLDNRSHTQGTQFKYKINQDGQPALRGNDALNPAHFDQLLVHIEQVLQQFGNRIYAGEISISPFRKKTETACQTCDFKPVCRFDDWLQPYRVLNQSSAILIQQPLGAPASHPP